MTPYLFRKPGRHEGHLKRVAVGVKRVERVRTDDAQDRVNAPAELSANCKEKNGKMSLFVFFPSHLHTYFFAMHVRVSIGEGERRDTLVVLVF